MSSLKVTLLAGGVGGAKAAEGLAKGGYGNGLSVIGNIADDQSFHGLWVSPDIDTLVYTLAERIDRTQGWGLANDTQQVLTGLNRLGVETWMQLGDMDFATHIYRTEKRAQGVRPQVIAQHIAKVNGVQASIVLPTDDVVQTQLQCNGSWYDFQDYFVRLRCQPKVEKMDYRFSQQAQATPEAIAALTAADLVVIAPSNPLLSIGAILSVEAIRTQLSQLSVPIVAVSPLIAGKAIKGPAIQLMSDLGLRPDVLGIAQYYQDVIDVLYIDNADAAYADQIEALGIKVLMGNIYMDDETSKVEVMTKVVDDSLSLGVKRAM
ncbi:2-phospho-L-lactate transferase CofD family protein [Vibrio hippocampi]|uniref:Phosphoenolpyruvate transferase n=1 Tax=Vibrio hippocampi TaxID=654686 RepID=A0ABM8ZLK5_9VIBR|nr:2-phospho-L-lactate transferase CofD family protein [Vibrio hippocampi]CAH0529135.1 Phosphoenolpyruvate transferase [Vibrio hippocampi]